MRPPILYFSGHQRITAVLGLMLVLLGHSVARAVVVESGDGTGNVTAPEDDPGFSNIGIRGVATAIYLGNRWVLTAAHVGAGPVQLGQNEFGFQPAQTVRVPNPEDLTPETDLLLFRLAEDPGLPSLHLPCDARRLGGELIMIGHGHDRQPDPTFWSVEVGSGPEDDVWTEVSSEAESDRRGV